jgi:hypothetical protein
LLRKSLDKFQGKMAVIGISYGAYTKDEQDSWAASKKAAKINWPIGLDEKETYVSKLYPRDSVRWSYVFIDKSGKRRNETAQSPEGVDKVVEQLLKEK